MAKLQVIMTAAAIILTLSLSPVYAQQNITEYHELLKLDKQMMTPETYQTVKNAILDGPYTLTLAVTEDTTNQTEGMMIDQYVAGIENQTKNSNFTANAEN